MKKKVKLLNYNHSFKQLAQLERLESTKWINNFALVPLIAILFVIVNNIFVVDKVLGQFQPNSALESNSSKEIKQKNLIEIKEIQITGNTVFSDYDFEKIVSSLEGKRVTIERLLRIRIQITDYYVEHGYINSGAFIPSQELTDGVVKVNVIEGSLAAIEIEGLSSLKKSYITSRLPTLDKPLNISDLTNSLTKLNSNPLIDSIDPKLEQLSLGKSILRIKIKETKPLTTKFSLSNNYSSSIGRLGGTASASYHALGYGDLLSIDLAKTAGLTRYGANYVIPFNKYDGTLGLSYVSAKSEIIEDPVSALDIQSDYEAFELTLRHPFGTSRSSELAFEAALELIDSETFVRDDFSFAFVDGLENGQSRITALRLTQDFFSLSEKNSIAIRSKFNIGLDVFDATETSLGRDALFWSWQGQTQWLRKFHNFSITSTLNVQLTPDKLLPLEQFTLGGRGSVKGYRQNLNIGDNGVTANVELQIPIAQVSQSRVAIIPFVDSGAIWNNSSEMLESNTLFSTGLGISYELKDILELRLDYAIPLIEVDAPEDFSTEQEFSFFLLFTP